MLFRSFTKGQREDRAIDCNRPSDKPNAILVKMSMAGTSLVVQWVRLRTPNAGGLGSIPGQGTRSHMHAATKSLHAATKHAAMKILRASTKTGHSQN